MTNKIFVAEFKAIGDPEQGLVEFYASTFGKLDSKSGVYGPADKMGDVMDPQAFDETLANDYRASNKRLPVAFAHALGGGNVPGADPFAFIGYAEANDVLVDDHGLRVKSQVDMDNPFAVQVHKLMKQGLINQASFSFTVLKQKRQNDGSTLIQKVRLYEAGPCLIGVNGEAEVLAVKALQDAEVDAALAEALEIERKRTQLRLRASQLHISASESL